jgi:hypothetical protein
MSRSCISNPPYNITWEPVQSSLYGGWTLPPSSNANLAFVLSGINQVDDKAVFIMPNGLLTSNNYQEAKIRRELVERNLLSAVITLPDKMFESTAIPVCVLVFDKNKKDEKITFINHKERFKPVERLQRGQYGGASHTGRVYKKIVSTLTDEMIDDIAETIAERKSEPGFSVSVDRKEVTDDWMPTRHIEAIEEDVYRRPIWDILMDIKRTTEAKNAVKLTINEGLAKRYGINISREDLRTSKKLTEEINQNTARFYDIELPKDDYLSLTKNKNEIVISCNSEDGISAFFMLVVPMIQQQIYYLNTEENRLMAELRDVLMYELFSNHGANLPEGMIETEEDE